jgi:hypothetical protein
MSARSRPKPPSRPAPRPQRRHQRAERPIHREGAVGDTCFPWKPGEMLVGQPRASRGKAQEPGNA